MSTTASEESYECPIHKTAQQGPKRETFADELFEALLLYPMDVTYKLYKRVKHGCHCTENYKAFDAILLEANAPKTSQTAS